MDTLAKLIKMPRLGLTMTEGVIIKWLKNENEYVQKGEKLVEIESDKSTADFESPEEGYLIKILAQEGDTVACQEDIAALGEQGEVFVVSPAEQSASPVAQTAASAQQAVPSRQVAQAHNGSKIFASPAAKRVAREKGVDLSLLAPAPGKVRIEKKDVLVYADANRFKATPVAQKIAAERSINLSSVGKSAGERIYSSDLAISAKAAKEDKIIPVGNMRKVIAQRMRESLDVAAHVSLSTEVDMTRAVEMRTRIADSVTEKYGVKPSLNDIVLKCVASALAEHPRLNSVFDGTSIIERGEINLGVAVALSDGLVVPVIRNCDMLSIGEIAVRSRHLAQKARDQGLSTEEMSGGTFTVSNLGSFGITQFTSIINQPESAILSVGQVAKKAVVTPEDEVVIRPMMNLTINFDHRPIDGAVAAQFLQNLKALLEEPLLIIA